MLKVMSSKTDVFVPGSGSAGRLRIFRGADGKLLGVSSAYHEEPSWQARELRALAVILLDLSNEAEGPRSAMRIVHDHAADDRPVSPLDSPALELELKREGEST